MDADGSNQTQLTFAFHAAQEPSWSRDGTKIAFVGTWECPGCAYTGRPFTDQLYVMDADGSNQTLLTTEWFADRFVHLVSDTDAPTWSPDGQMIAFRSSSPDRRVYGAPYVIRADGSGLARLQPDAMYHMDWSPDGKRLVYDLRGRGIRISNAPPASSGDDEDTATTELTTRPGDRYAAWSLDGNRIVFNRSPLGDGSPPHVFVMNADGSAQTDLTKESAGQLPVWSPDGTKIAFSWRGDINNEDIMVMNADGTGRTRLTTDASFDYQPSWQPQKSWLQEPIIELPTLKDSGPPPTIRQSASQAIPNPCLFGLALPWTC